MNYLSKFIKVLSFSVFMFSFDAILCSKSELKKAGVVKISIIVGSVRATTTGKQIAQNLQTLLAARSDIVTEIIFVGDYQLPFYTSDVSPASRKGEITDPALKKWSDCIKQAEAFIIVSPEYNAGYSASLKNALDSLYQEWNCKPVGIVGYSGGISGGTCMIAQLKQVLQRLEMVPVETCIAIPCSWKAFDKQGGLVSAQTIAKDLNLMVDQLLQARNK